jgi:hypothetical protein
MAMNQNQIAAFNGAIQYLGAEAIVGYARSLGWTGGGQAATQLAHAGGLPSTTQATKRRRGRPRKSLSKVT